MPDAIVDSVGDNDGLREGVNATSGQPLVRFLPASSSLCKEGACVTFWAMSTMATSASIGRITLRSQLDFPAFGGAIAFWMYMETEILYNPRFVSKFQSDPSLSNFQIGLMEISPRNSSGLNRTSFVNGSEEFNFFTFRCFFQYKTSTGVLVPSAQFEFKTHPTKQQWQHITVSFGKSGVNLFRDFVLVETIPINDFGGYDANTSLPVVVGNHPTFLRAPAARIDELRFFGYNSVDDDVTEQNLQSLLKPLSPTPLPTPQFSGQRTTTKFSRSGTPSQAPTTTTSMMTMKPPTGTTNTQTQPNNNASTSAGEATNTTIVPFDQVVDQSSGGNRRALIGGLIGGLLAVILLVALLAWIVVREKRRNRENQEPIDVHPQPQAIDAAPSTSIGMYDPAQPTPVATKRNMYTAAPRSTPAELLANYGSTPEPSNFDVRGDNNRYDRAPEAKALYNV